MILRPLTAAVLLALSFSATAADARRAYIVQLLEPPVAAYTGGVAGLAATKPAAGQRLNAQASSVQQYADYLRQRQASVLALVGGAPVLHEYKTVLNGFAALLTDAEVRQLKASGTVASITADEQRHLLTSFTPAFLGLEKPDGLWSKLGGPEHAGEDIIVGIIDSGLWPENPSYADRIDKDGKPTFANDGTLAYGPAPAGWSGECQTGEGFTAAHCNNKLIGARYFDASFQAFLEEVGRPAAWSEFRSPRDSIGGAAGSGGHGTHTSSTAAGNRGVDAKVNGSFYGVASGMAPRARVAAYKICWSYLELSSPTLSDAGCWTGDSIKAIEQAVEDGVHVLNFSISGGSQPNDPVELAFLRASDAGVFVAASAGNSGPGNAVAHISPWLTTVAASTHNRFLKADITLGSNAVYAGASLNPSALPKGTPLVRAQDAGLSGAEAEQLGFCFSAGANDGKAVLDPSKVQGKIVTCTRGGNDRVDKSKAVKEAGGVGMVMIDNGAEGGLIAEGHSVPTVHVSMEDGEAIAAYAAKAGSSAGIGKFVTSTKGEAPVMAGFSSRGPNMFDPNVLKPDLTAPGVNILAGVTPALTSEQRANILNGTFTPPSDWNLYQGTSMSSPHVAGLAALLKQRHPDWSPSVIKSALMTTGYDTLPDGRFGAEDGTLPWGQGAGHVNPNGAADPGLVYAIANADYNKYLCGAGMTNDCAAGSIAGYELNLPSITVANVIATTAVKRTVTNVGNSAATYTGKVEVHGFNAVLSPSTLTLAPGESKDFTVSLTRTTAYENIWQMGTLVWTDGSHVVRSPVTARTGRLVTAPGALRSELASGSTAVSVQTAFTGRMGASQGGLKEITRSALRVGQLPAGSGQTPAQLTAACKAGGAGVLVQTVRIPADTVAASFELFDSDTGTPGIDDLDLVLLDSSGKLAVASAIEGSNEAALLASPAPGDYRLCVLGHAAANQSSIDFQLSSAIVAKGELGGGLKVMLPTRVYLGKRATVGISWDGLPKGKRYLGGVQYLDMNGNVANTTLVQVETDDPLPLARAERRAAAVDPRK